MPLERPVKTYLDGLKHRTRERDLADSRVVTILLYIFFAVALVSALAAVLAALPGWLSGVVAFFTWVDGFAQNLGTEMLGAIITFVLIQVLLEGRRALERKEEERQREQENAALFERIVKRTEDQITGFLREQQSQITEQERQRWISQLASPIKGFATEAARQLRHHGWLRSSDVAEGLRAGGDLAMVDLRGLDLTGEDLEYASLKKANLDQCTLDEADLSHATLEKATLRKTDLIGTDLCHADLKQADLQGATLTSAALSDADMRGCTLDGATLGAAVLRRTQLQKARLIDADLHEADLRDAHFEKAKLRKAMLRGADLRGTQFDQATLIAAQLQRADLQGADLRSADLSSAQLEEANLQGALLDRAELQKATLVRAILLEASLADSNLSLSSLEDANLNRANLKQADLSFVRLAGANLQRAVLDGTCLYNAYLNGADLHGAVLTAALGLTVEQLRTAATLAGCTLPDGTLIPDDPEWGPRLEAWIAHRGAEGRLAAVPRACWDELSGDCDWDTEVTEHEIIVPGGSLRGANLHNQPGWTVEILQQSVTLEGCTLPDGTRLPGRAPGWERRGEIEPDWRSVFRMWVAAMRNDGRLRAVQRGPLQWDAGTGQWITDPQRTVTEYEILVD
ncbi:MAG: pentapeptide repeat-containing protein [Anaerolineae bacterium]